METKPYDPGVLLDSEEAIALAIEEAMNDEDPRVLPMVLKDVAKARGVKVAQLAEAAGVNRESLYKTLRGTDVKWSTIKALLRAMDIQIKVTV